MAPGADDSVTSARRSDRLELLATVLMALAAVATAWSSYQAARWSGEQAVAASRTNAIRIEAAEAADLANAESEVDVATFIAWADARLRGEAELERFHEDRFRDEFRFAFDAWMAADPFEDPAAPKTPFAMEEYRVESKVEAKRLNDQAEASAAAVRRDVQRSTNYVLAVVLFAVALFFGGMGSKLSSRSARVLMVASGYCVLLVGLVWIAVSPVSLAI